MRPSINPSLLFAILLSSTPSVLGDVLFVSPTPGASVVGGSTFTVSWKDSGSPPAITDLTAYQLFLFSGSNAQPQQLFALTNAAFAAGNSVTVTVPVSVGGTGTNAYFLGIMSTSKTGGTITNYSTRFTLTGMTGTFPAAVIASNKNIAGTDGPAAVNQIAAVNPGAGGGSIAQGAWATPYNMQVGPTRYAPMQPVPPKKITKTNTDPLWPTSSVVVATTFLPVIGTAIVTTQTQPQTYSAASHANSAAAQSHPIDDMQKFLNRWKD